MRSWRLRSRLAVLLVIPLVLAGVLGSLRIAQSVGDAQALAAVERQVALSERVATVIDGLQTERHLAAAATATGAPEQRSLVTEQIQQVDDDVAAMRDLEPDSVGLAATPAAAYRDVLTRIETLSDLRERVVSPETTVDLAIGRYSEVITPLLQFNRVALAGTAAESSALALGIGYLAEAKEQLSVQHAVLLAASLGNVMTSVQESELRETDAAFDAAIRTFSESIPSSQRQIYFTTVRGDPPTDRDRLLLIGLGEWPTFVALNSIAAEWDEAATAVGAMFLSVEASLSDDLLAATAAASNAAVTDAIRDASIVALLLIVALGLLVLVARSVLRPLQVLRTSALDVAQRGLPAAVEQLRRPGGWEDDIRPEPVPVHTREDIGQVARAFDQVHREAIRLAAEQAMMRSNVNDMFVNLSRRSQSMVERQLHMIDSLERGERDPEALAELFRLDHLATRMRRNNENLLVLAGSELRRRAGSSRSVLDVLRGAISEIEDYPRVSIEGVPDVAVRGIAVNDLVHLIAELLDNATTYSPKDKQVILASSVDAEGRLRIDVRDAGVGMSAPQRNLVNDRLAAPPAVDVSVSRQMGLFVVGRLAGRHGIDVRLVVSGPSGGLTAEVSVPGRLVAPAEADAAGLSRRPLRAAGLGRPDSVAPAEIGSGDDPPEAAFGSFVESPEPASGSVVELPEPTRADILSREPIDFFALVPETAPPREESGTPIFQQLRSAWFGAEEPELAAPRTPLPAETVAAPFATPADAGWQAAERARNAVDAGTTAAGLPRRLPRAQLVPGSSARTATEPGAPANGQTDNISRLRDAERVRGNLSSFQRGTHRGRHASPTLELP